MKPFFDALNAAMPSLPADYPMIRRMAEALKIAATAEHEKLSQYDRSDAIAGLIDNLSDFLAEYDEEQPTGTDPAEYHSPNKQRSV